MSVELQVACAVLVVIVGMGGISLLMYQRLSRSISLLKVLVTEASDNTIAQIEALLGIQVQLSLREPLPPTRGWAASPDFLRNIMVHALRTKPAMVVECSSGVSSVVLARCMQINGRGHVYSLENDPVFAQKTRDLLRLHGVDGFATVIDAPLVPTEIAQWSGKWYDLRELPADRTIDLLVIDGPPWFVSGLARFPAVPALHDRLAPDAAIFLDDAARSDETECVRRWRAAYPDLVVLDVPRCEKGCTALIKRGEVRFASHPNGHG